MALVELDLSTIHGWYGVFGADRRGLTLKMLKNAFEMGTPIIVIDTYGYFSQALHGSSTSILRLGVDVSINLFKIAEDGSEDSITRLAEVFQSAFDIDDSEQKWVLEALRVIYSEDNPRPSFTEITGWLMEAKALTSIAEGYRLEALISKLYMATAGSGVMAMEDRLGRDLWSLDLSGLTIIDLSTLPSLRARGAAQVLIPIVLALREELPDGLHILIDSANISMPEKRRYTRYELALKSMKVASLIEHLDVLRERGCVLGLTAPVMSMLDLDIVRLLETLVLLEPALSRDYSLALRLTAGRIGKRPPSSTGLLISPRGAIWFNADLSQPGLTAELRLKAGREGVRPPRPLTLLEAVFHEYAVIVGRFIEALRIALMTRSEAVEWFKRVQIDGETADDIVNRMLGFGLIRETFSAGRRILIPTIKGLEAYEEARLRGVIR